MTAITCSLAQVNAGVLPPFLAGRLLGEITNRYSAGSNGVIDLTVTESTVPPLFPGNEPVGAYYLHQMLGAVTNNQTNPLNIAVLYASSYAVATHGILGVMFDRGFPTADDPNPAHQPPRLGCAVFLDTIRHFRGDGQNFMDEAVFTTLHELGHVFNLWHIKDFPNIMETSPADTVIPQQHWTFEETQRSWLANCGFDDHVTPGGCPYMGDDSTAFDGPDWLNRASPKFGLSLTIDVQPREFWRFEPVQLDLCLQTVAAPHQFVLPDEIDPGHKRFRIFIEDSNTERRMYQPPQIF
jgi:hypothetical protein